VHPVHPSIRRGAQIALELAVNIVLPYVIYVRLKPSLGDFNALVWSMAPALLWGIGSFIWQRRVDVVSVFAVGGIVLSMLAAFGGGSVRLLQLRENLVTGVFAIAFLVSAAIGRPLIFELARAAKRRESPSEGAAFEELAQNARVRSSMMVMTVVWGTGLLVQTAAACALVFVIPIATYLIVSPVLAYGTMGLLALWTLWYVRTRRRAAHEPRTPA
jgi:hypothetical protein